MSKVKLQTLTKLIELTKLRSEYYLKLEDYMQDLNLICVISEVMEDLMEWDTNAQEVLSEIDIMELVEFYATLEDTFGSNN